MYRVCNVCGANDAEPMLAPARSPGPLVRCKCCGFVYINPVERMTSLIVEGPILQGRSPALLESSDLAAIPGSWEESLIDTYMQEHDAKRVNAIDALERIERLRPAKGRILDVGCFCGVFLNAAQERGWQAQGIEPLVMPSVYARGRFGLSVKTDTLRPDTFPAESFDVITAFQVFEHLVDPASELVKIRRFLRPGGLMLIEVPNIETPLLKVMKAKHRHFVEDHVSFFSARTLGELFTRAHFSVREVYYPTRALSLHHVTTSWIGRYAGSGVSGTVDRTLTRAGLEKHTVRINLQDIVAVIAQKD